MICYSATQTIPTHSMAEAAKHTRKNVQQAARICANFYWADPCESIQQATDSGTISYMYAELRKAVGPAMRKTVPLQSSSGELITDANL